MNIDWFNHIQVYRDIFYKDSTHEYFNITTKKKLTSVTTKISEYKKPFDKYNISKAISIRDNIPQHELLKLWQYKNDTRKIVGSLLHNYMEATLERCIYEPALTIINEDQKLIYEKLKVLGGKFIKDYYYNGNYISIMNEFIVGNDNIAGRFDNLSKSLDRIKLVDYKSNTDLYKQAYSNFTGKLDHLPQDKITEYTLQLSTYKSLLNLPEDIPVDLEIVWIMEDNEDYVIIPIKELKEEANIICQQ